MNALVVKERKTEFLQSRAIVRQLGYTFRGEVGSIVAGEQELVVRMTRCQRHLRNLRWVNAPDREVRIPLNAETSIHANGRCTIRLKDGAIVFYPSGCPDPPRTCGAVCPVARPSH